MVEAGRNVISEIQEVGTDGNKQVRTHFRNAIIVRYLDHVHYNRAFALAMKPQIRKAIGAA